MLRWYILKRKQWYLASGSEGENNSNRSWTTWEEREERFVAKGDDAALLEARKILDKHAFIHDGKTYPCEVISLYAVVEIMSLRPAFAA